jgi:peptidyl-prolyl cis-trans isomerase D
MFDFVERNRTAVQVVLGVVTLGLVIGFGVTGLNAWQGGDDYLAKVGGTKITERELNALIGNRSVPDEMKPMVIEQMIQRQLLLEEAKNRRVFLSESALREMIAENPAFQLDGKFDAAKYREALLQAQKTPEGFEQEVRDQVVIRRMLGGLLETGIAGKAQTGLLARLLSEKREVQALRFTPQQYADLKEVVPTEAEIKAYYDAHQADYKLPEAVRVQYLTLSQAQLAGAVQVSDQEVEKYFAEHKADFAGEERKISHILLMPAQDAKAEKKAEVKKQAEALLTEVRKNPARFAELAKQKSQDPGSAANGGALGNWIKRDGQLVKPFEDASFTLAKGAISDLVETQYGYHIIKVDDVRAKQLADVKAEIVQRLKAQKAQAQFQAQQEKLSELAYQQADSLKPAADELKLKLEQSNWIKRKNSEDPLFAEPKMLDAIFSDDVLKKKHNTEAIEVAPGVVMVARVIEHKAEQMQPLANVSAGIAATLKQEKIIKHANEAGAAQIKVLQAGNEAGVNWSKPLQVQRVDPQGLNQALLRGIFQVDAAKVPAYVGGEDGANGYVIYKVVKVLPDTPASDEDRQALAEQISRVGAMAAVRAYLDTLKQNYKVAYGKMPTPAVD